MTQQVRIESVAGGSNQITVQTFGGDVLVSEKTLKPGESGDWFVWNGQTLAIKELAS